MPRTVVLSTPATTQSCQVVRLFSETCRPAYLVSSLRSSKCGLPVGPIVVLGRGQDHLSDHESPSQICPHFFCISNVIATLLVSSKLAEGAEIKCPSLKNLMFLRQRSFVCRSSVFGTIKYSQDWHAKNVAPMVNWLNAISNSVTCCFASLSSTMKGRAFCCFC